ncbi:D-amino acid oxidase, putative [Ixodes scapularis]|uniref:D-amino acid oxidase, putative n=1 Tax=Ixodes scapularis TaxID=6945 RepID=B7PDQ6_IXOSC|nr:D-amino acid oxidase, putative [Ixodes scapularis]|eukprot:XP_002411000.1 D-amino acid oxidase, putative [Ixodes scapularis]
MVLRVGVVGGGIIGLTTALKVLETIDNVNVTIIAEHFTPHTTGDVAGGFFEPYLMEGMTDEKLRHSIKKCINTFEKKKKRYASCTNAKQTLKKNVQTVTTRKQANIRVKYSRKRESVQSCSTVKQTLHVSFYVLKLRILTFQPCTLFVSSSLASRGCHFVRKKLDTLDQLAGKFDVVMNCPGIGAVSLVPDPDVYPVRGQTTWVSAPWVKRVVVAGEYYIIPNVDAIVLGGTANKGDFSLDPVQETRQKILDACMALEPSLKEAKFVRDHVGLRPGRTAVRIEIEDRVLDDSNKTLPIVHNYGHGGSGITVSWGSAEDAVNLLKQVIAEKGLPSNAQSKL